ncbi:MAG: metal ABC transporter permease [Candidatus Sumerlaeaceae bacterium]
MSNLADIVPTFWRDLVEYAFWRHAVVGGLATAAVCSLLSVYVVLRRMAFIGQGISHSALGGYALGILLFGSTADAALRVDATALVFCLGVAVLIALTTRHSKISEDSAIGIFFVASMALGAVFFKMAPGFNQDVYSYLFGSILALNKGQLWLTCGLAAVVATPLLLLQKELLYYTFDEEMAGVSGVPVNVLHFLLVALLSVTVIISARLVGILLVSAFLILPGATAQLLTQRFNRMVVLSIMAGVLTTLVGLLLSHATDWPSGAAVVLVQFAVFLVVFAIRKFQGLLSV